MNFRKASRGGGGGISNPKIYVADFESFYRAFWDIFREKLQHNFPKKGGSGGLKAAWIFSENSSVLVP